MRVRLVVEGSTYVLASTIIITAAIFSALVVRARINRLDLERAIARLPEGSRAAFLLHDVEGFQHQEIAAILGISEGTSKSQVHKARLRLRALLTAAL